MEDGLRPEQGRSVRYRDARREEERIMGFAGDGGRGKEEIGMPWAVSHQSGLVSPSASWLSQPDSLWIWSGGSSQLTGLRSVIGTATPACPCHALRSGMCPHWASPSLIMCQDPSTSAARTGPRSFLRGHCDNCPHFRGETESEHHNKSCAPLSRKPSAALEASSPIRRSLLSQPSHSAFLSHSPEHS